MGASASKDWQTGAKWEGEEASSTIKDPTRDLEEDNLIFIFFANLKLTAIDYISGIVWYFEALVNILFICVIYWVFRVFATDGC